MKKQKQGNENKSVISPATPKRKPKNIYGAALWTSLFSLVMCISMLSGTTYAWFSDMASNKNNRIQAGSFSMNVVGYNTTDGIAVTDGTNEALKPITFSDPADTRPLINETMKAGTSNVKYITISNTGSLDFKYRLKFVIPDDSNEKLTDVLWYKIGKVDALTSDFGAGVEQKNMAMIKDQGFIASLNGKVEDDIKLDIYKLEYGMLASAGATYLDKTFKLDILVEAYQEATPTEEWTEPTTIPAQ